MSVLSFLLTLIVIAGFGYIIASVGSRADPYSTWPSFVGVPSFFLGIGSIFSTLIYLIWEGPLC